MKQLMTLLALWAMSCCAMAQTDTIVGRVHELEGVTVTESQRRHTLTSTAPLHLLDRRDMLSMGITDMADALHRLPGITLRDYGGAGGMKTVSVRGFGAKHTGVSYDGVMLSECQSGEIDLSRYSLDNVEGLSLTIGDNDDIFIPARQSSTPAVLNIETLRMRTDDTRPHLTAQVKQGSFGLISPFVRYEQNLSNRFAFSLVGEYTYADNDYPYSIQNGNETVSDRRSNSRMNSWHGELNFLYQTNRVSRLSGKLYYYDNDRQLPGQVHYYTNLSGEALRDRNAFGQLLYQTRWDDKLSLKWLAKYNWAESVYRDRMMQGGVNDASYWQREVYSSAVLLYTPDERWAMDYSMDYAFNNLNGSSWRTLVGKPYRHTMLQSATAKYQSRRLKVIVRLLLSLYLNGQSEMPATTRQDVQQNSADNMQRLSPSLSVSYKLLADQDLYVRASYKNIFRSPTFNESYYYHYGSTNLKPESTDQLNVGVTYTAPLSRRNMLTVTLDGYYNHVKDMIVAVPQNMFVWTCVNLDKVRSYGLDATMRASRQVAEGHQVAVAGSYSYQRVEDRNNPDATTYGYQVAYMPRHQGSLSVSYENPWVNVSLHGTSVSSRWPNNNHYEGTLIAGYTDCGATLWRQFRWHRHQLEARFDLKNVFDKHYEIVANYPMPGRNYQISINYKF
ncbi:MAG: TonB-dependent receptor [Prevotella sp.]|jgi:outer membrane cobalamin receptor|nr:TonB-dependent receptor [Prevotella sp.]MBQ5496610.1 TonB-dependent receptor [Prevotella sp.]MBQ5549225.1 TonB-dependent receptor [Prevotella sp.]